jgi:hypothetical protein
MATKTLPTGRYVQIYRGAVRGNSKAEKRTSIAQTLDKLKAVGVKGIVWHGFSNELTPNVFLELAAIATARGLLSLASFGDGDSDPDGFGRRVGAIANLPECVGVVLDMEGIWENEQDDKADAIKLGKALREVAPDALVIDQPWPVPNLHNSFPWDETAAYVDIRAPQYYVNNWIGSKGKDRYSFCWNWFEESWKKRNDKYAQKGLVKPMIKTIQGYKWFFKDLVHCLTSNPTLIVWSEPYPDQVFMAGLAVVQKLESLGFTGPEAVKAFQTNWNRTHPQDQIGIDNIIGPMTMSKLGLPPPPLSS